MYGVASEDDPKIREFAGLLLGEILKNKSITRRQLETLKNDLAGTCGLKRVPKNAEILRYVSTDNPDYPLFNKLLKMKQVRTASGVANIAVMWMPDQPENSCFGKCIYCPQGSLTIKGKEIFVPKSYTGTEPTTLRAIRNDFDPGRQIENRLNHFSVMGHPADKCELIIMGGTFTVWPGRMYFVKKCFDAFNGREASSLTEAQKINETALHRCIGLTIETRADACNDNHINEMLQMGCTRVEIGVQSTDDEILKKIERGHDASANISAFSRLRNAGLKITAHWMPGLTGLLGKIDMEKELQFFEKLFSQEYRPDELKIYPTLVIEGTKLHEMWSDGIYDAITSDQMAQLLVEMKKIIPEYVRVKRIMRDISEHESSAGASTTNLRQLVKEQMQSQGLICKCIRCREIGSSVPEGQPLLKEIKYEAASGAEHFLSFVDAKDRLLGFLRLRLGKEARVRELHVYGVMTPLGVRGEAVQHKGLGKALLARAEEIAKSNGYDEIFVTSGVGVRDYYRKQGYALSGYYMKKAL